MIFKRTVSPVSIFKRAVLTMKRHINLLYNVAGAFRHMMRLTGIFYGVLPKGPYL